MLEVDPSKRTGIDLASIVQRKGSTKEGPLELSRTPLATGTEHTTFSEGFVDDPDVPPLIWDLKT